MDGAAFDEDVAPGNEVGEVGHHRNQTDHPNRDQRSPEFRRKSDAPVHAPEHDGQDVTADEA
ncbi:hypothetical protein ACTWPT_46945 [Nonomuraea sp. 3N208]